MIRINLLPHREANANRSKAAFIAMLVLGGVLGVAIVLVVGGWNASRIAIQEPSATPSSSTENAELDKKIKDIATLKEEIERPESAPAGRRRSAGRPQPAGLPVRRTGACQAPEGVYLNPSSRTGRR